MKKGRNMKKIMAISTVFFLTMLVFAEAVVAGQAQYGKLVSVEPTGEGPDENKRSEYRVTMIISGITVCLEMWMTEDEYTELKGAEGEMITISYHWDGEGHRIYDGFEYGDHTLSQSFASVEISVRAIGDGASVVDDGDS